MGTNDDHVGAPPYKKRRTDTECTNADEGTSSKGLFTHTDSEDESERTLGNF